MDFCGIQYSKCFHCGSCQNSQFRSAHYWTGQSCCHVQISCPNPCATIFSAAPAPPAPHTFHPLHLSSVLHEQVSSQHYHPKIVHSFARHEHASGAAHSARTLASKWPFAIPERGDDNRFDSFTSKDHTPEFKQDPTSASYLAGRAGNEELPTCVKLNDSFETDIDGSTTFRAYQVPVPVDIPFLSCKATGAGDGEFALEMFTEEDDGTYCSNYNYLTETYECSVGGPTAFVVVNIYYFGLPTTITITCSNEPCTAPVCGDGFCSNELETPLSPGGATVTTCQEDCGKTCGDGICDTEVGENDSNCLSDCGCLYLNEKLNIDFAETVTYEIQVAAGESVECFSPTAFFDIGVILNYDEPPCLNFGSYNSGSPTPTPTASRSPSGTQAPSPCDIFSNDCISADYCSVGPAAGSQTLYVYVEGIYDFMGDFVCQRPKSECSFTEAPTSTPIKAPTKAPVKAPTSAPTSAPWPCFSKFTEVEVLGQGLTQMDALMIGDAVRASDGSFSTVYSFGHYDPHTVANFLQLWTDASNKPLEITGDHMLFVKQGGLGDDTNLKILPASAVKVGDLLVAPPPQQQHGSSSDAVVKVTSITTVQREGLYAPFTTSGNVVVNGVTASNYIALPPTFQAVTSFESQHWLQHLAYLPYRLYCGTAGCQNETYHGETGLSGAVTMWLPLLHWVEVALSWSLSAHGVAAALVYFVWKQHQQSTRQMILKK